MTTTWGRLQDHWRRMVLAAALITSFAFSPSAFAFDDADRAAGQEVVKSQIEAFRRDDGVAAYGLAAPSIQQMFPSQDVFMEMVRQGYKPVYRPRSYEFGPSRDDGDTLEQSLRIQDAEGVDWDAVYSLQRQGDGSWKITGCRLVKRPGDSA